MYMGSPTIQPLQNSSGPGHICLDIYAVLFTMASEHTVFSNEKIWVTGIELFMFPVYCFSFL